ncbi:MAG: hypothetical protein ACP5QT_05420, partial [Brevinematia bacterium]
MDLCLNISIKGFNIRLSLLLIILLDIVFLIYVLKNKEIFLLPSFDLLWLWGLFLFLFSANSLLILRGIGYGIWLLTLIFWCIVTSNFAKDYGESILRFVMLLYIISFLPAILFGLVQFFVPTFLFSKSFLYKTQFAMMLGKYYSIHRINGFNYEPSYYVTYLIPLLPLLWSWIKISNRNEKLFGMLFLIISSITIVLSTSRAGWIGLILFFIWVIAFEM